MSDKKNILISLHKGYGLGDAVRQSAVLRHVAHYRPEWSITYQAERGKEVVGKGIVDHVVAYGERHAVDHYDAEVQVCLYPRWYGYTDRPNTTVTQSLREHFDLMWDARFGRYQVQVSAEARDAVHALLYGFRRGTQLKKIGDIDPNNRRRDVRYVAVHYQGRTDITRKNLTHTQADDVCHAIERMGYIPLILDWQEQSILPYRKLRTPSEWGTDAEMVTAVIAQCEAFVGIDSGPAKCASATEVPSLVVWTGHHPAEFHDPAPNTTHLVPYGVHTLEPVCGNGEVIQWFEEHYRTRTYTDDIVGSVKQWLRETLQ